MAVHRRASCLCLGSCGAALSRTQDMALSDTATSMPERPLRVRQQSAMQLRFLSLTQEFSCLNCPCNSSTAGASALTGSS